MDRAAAESLLSEIANPRVRDAFMQVDRAEFVRAADRDYAWSDCAMKIEGGATISQPSLVAYMTEQLDPQPEHHVLEIGTGSGYQTAILARLAKEVFSVEVHPLLYANATERLESMQINNVHLRCADGRKGWAEEAPFDRIICTVAFPGTPEKLLKQLRSGGRLLAPVGTEHGRQWLTAYDDPKGRVKSRRLIPVRFLSLRG